MNKEKALKQFLNENKLIQLATQSDGKLWICNLYFAVDENSNIYWTSARNRRHSIEIEANSNVAATIVHDQDSKQAVQISGTATRINASESYFADELYSAKFGQKDRLQEVMDDKPGSRAYWKLTPELIELWDEVNFPEAPKQRVEIRF